MSPDAFFEDIITPGVMLLWRITSNKIPVSAEADRMLLAIAQQESGPNLDARYQGSPSASPGPARGFWQFEEGGGVRGVLNHAASGSYARMLCEACCVQPYEGAVWRALEGHDLLACGFARLLLWTDPYPIPTTQQSGWECYAERLWRPGKPHPDTWPGNWAVASKCVGAR